MAEGAPWEKYNVTPAAGGEAGPWAKYAPAATPSTKLERFGAGLADPIYGAAQLAARMPVDPENPGLNFGPELETAEARSAAIDKTVSEREQGYKASRKAAGSEGIDWMRGAGATVATAPLALAGGAAAGIPAAAVGGAAGAALEPVAEEGNFGVDKATQIGVGGAAGGALGAAGKAVGSGISHFGQWLAKEFPENIMSQAVKTVMRRMEQDTNAGGPTAKDAIDLVNAANAEGKPMTLADVGGKNSQRLAGNVSRSPGESANIAESFLTGRDEGAARRLEQDISKYVHGGKTMEQTTDALLESRSRAAKPAWDDVRQMQGVWSPRLEQFFENPSVRKGMARGYEIERNESLAQNRPFNPTQMGVDLDEQGNIKILAKPNMRVLHMAKMGLDAEIAAERNELTGKLSARGVSLDQVRRAYLQEIDSLDTKGVYKNARALWEGPSASLDAVRAGRSVFKGRPAEIAAEFNAMSPANQEFYRVGVADAIRERVAKTGLTADEAKSIIRNAWTRDQLRPVFRTAADFNAFVNSVTQEGQMYATARKTLAGSQTAERLAEDNAPEHAGAHAAAHVAKNVVGGEWFAAAKNAWRYYRDLGLRPDPKLNEQIAKILFTTDLPAGGEVAQRMTGTFKGVESTNHLSPLARGAELSGSALAPGAGAEFNSP